MTIVSSKELATNQDKYFDIAMKEQVFVQRGDDMFLLTRTNEHEEPDMIFEPDEDFYRSVSMEELRKRVLEDIHQWYKEKNEGNSHIFDYSSIAKEFQISEKIVRKIEKEVEREIPNDNMIMELHVLRTLKAYANKHQSTFAQ